ncbi:MAG: penicillin acylase family protein [Neomegalonema sp.]|nr:penicillin acylase family protein [Neomegalonema sp.]
MRAFRMIRWLVIAAAGIALIGVLFLYVLMARSLPDYNVEHETPGLSAEVEIVRDSRAAPHIFGKSERDVYFALGFSHAQDRLWQMELMRRIAGGRLSELGVDWALPAAILGGKKDARALLLRIDATARALDIEGASKRSLSALSPDARSILKAYADGVNAWIKVVDQNALGGGSPELMLLGATVSPWRPEDSISVLKLMSALSSSPFLTELKRAHLLLAAGPARAADLLPAGAPTTFVAVSQAWAVSAARSGRSAPLLAADPGLPLLAPGLWYVARLDFGDGGAIGATLPGAPVLLTGRNTRVAWGFGALAADTGDFFIEKLDPKDPSRYRTPTGWEPLERRKTVIGLSGGNGVEVELMRTRHGPVIPLDWPQLARITPEGHVAALSWTILADDDTTIEAMLRLARVKSVDEALALRSKFIAPAQMLVVADRKGVANVAVGRIPLRRASSLSRGKTPGLGWKAENDWVGALALDQLPTERDPVKGYVVAIGGRPATSAFPQHLGFDWPATYRALRLEELLSKRQYHSPSGFQSMQSDVASEMARTLLPLIATPLWKGVETEPERRQKALEMLRTWYGSGEETLMDALRPEPLIFTAWMRALTRRLTEDELAAAGPGVIEGALPRYLERVYSDKDGAAGRWCDDVRTPTAESCMEIARLALDDALDELTKSYGSTMTSWRWGRAHEAIHTHPVYGSASVASMLFTISHELGGGAHTLRRTYFTGTGPTPYQTVSAGGFRAVYDFGDLDRSVYAIATGQSGHVLSRHFDDFAPLWRAGGYAPLSLSRREAEAGSIGFTRLKPTE